MSDCQPTGDTAHPDGEAGYLAFLDGIQPFATVRLVEACAERLPMQLKRCPWQQSELNHGTALLQSAESMDAYMAAYGDMHIQKCRAALLNFPFDRMGSNSFEIVDWGCGQGIATLCLLETLQSRDLAHLVRQVTLVEPSPHALARAKANVERMGGKGLAVTTFEAFLPGTVGRSFGRLGHRSGSVIHLFSNVLDLNGIALNQLAASIATPRQTHYLLCIGPRNPKSQRIDTFWEAFGRPACFAHVDEQSYGRTAQTLHEFSCKLRCFVHQGEIPPRADAQGAEADVPIYDDYDEKQAGHSSPLQGLKGAFEHIMRHGDTVLIRPNLPGPSPDLLIISPGRGIVIVQSFGGDLNDFAIKRTTTKANGNRDTGLDANCIVRKDTEEEAASPLPYLEACQEYLVGLLADEQSYTPEWARRGVRTVRKVAFFPMNTQAEVDTFFTGTTRNHVLLLGTDPLYIEQARFTLQRDLRLQDDPLFGPCRHELLLNQLTPCWHTREQGVERTLSRVQRELATSVAGRMQKISGVAGSGKTQVLAMRAVDAARRTGGRVLVLCFNKTLVNYLKQRIGEVPADFFFNRFTIEHFHGFINSQAQQCLAPPPGNGRRFYPFDDFNAMKRLFEHRQQEPMRYQAIFIDEVQDFHTAWLQLLRAYFLAEGGEFVVFGDPKQNIYNRPLDKEGNIELGAIIGGLWNKRLCASHRFTNPALAKLAYDFQRQFLPTGDMGTPPQADLFDDSVIKYALVNDHIPAGKLAAYCMETIRRYGLSRDQTIILSPANDILQEIEPFIIARNGGQPMMTTFVNKEEAQTRDTRFIDQKEDLKRRAFSMDKPGLKMSSIASFKGWEAEAVILIIPKTASPAYVYTGITRTRSKLFILNMGNDEYHQFFSQRVPPSQKA